MKAIKIELIMEDNEHTEHFITQILPNLKEDHKMKQVHWHNCEYFEKQLENKMGKEISLKCSICKKRVAKVNKIKMILPFEIGCDKCLEKIEKGLKEVKNLLK